MSICLLRYEVGDKIVLRDDLITDIWYSGWSFCGDMLKNSGRKIEILGIAVMREPYYIATDGSRFYTDQMIDHDKTKKLQLEESVNMGEYKKELTIMDLEVGKEYFATSIYENEYNSLFEISSSGDVIITYGMSKQKKDIAEVFTSSEIIGMRFKEVDRPYEETIQDGDRYYYITGRGDIGVYNWDDNNFDNSVANGLGIYKTEEDAKVMYDKVVEFIKNERENI